MSHQRVHRVVSAATRWKALIASRVDANFVEEIVDFAAANIMLSVQTKIRPASAGAAACASDGRAFSEGSDGFSFNAASAMTMTAFAPCLVAA